MADETKLLVLVVSDDPLVRDEAEYGFPNHVTVRMGTDSRDAWQLILDELPDVVVVDLQTGSAGGFDLIMALRQDERTEAIPALLLLERPQDAWLADQAGATAARVKPLEPSELAAETVALAGAANRS